MTSAATRPWAAMTIAEAQARLTAPGARFEMEEVAIRGVPTRVFRNAPPTLRHIFATARGYGPGRTFIVHEEERVDYEAFARASLALAAGLAARGVGKGDRVAVAMRNLPEWIAGVQATFVLGAVAVPLNAWWSGEELEYGLRDCGARIALVDHERYERLRPHLSACPGLEHVLVARAQAALVETKASRLEDLIGTVAAWGDLPDRPIPTTPLWPEDDAAICYTSGTTGRPKGAVLTHRNIASNVLSAGFALARHQLRRGQAPQPPDRGVQRAALIAVPLFHVTGLCSNLTPLMNLGAKLVLMPRWDAGAALALIERERVNQTGGVPTIAWQLLEHPQRTKHDLSSLDILTYGGAPSAPVLAEAIKAGLPDATAGQAWGMTETAGVFTSHVGDDYARRPDSCGLPVPTGDLRIVGARGQGLPPGEIGELCVRGPQVARGYWGQAEATAQSFEDGWLRTGDLASVNEEGFVVIHDRAKDMLIRGGENIYCIEVEHLLQAHPAVAEAALIGRPHRTLGEEPVAVVALAAGAAVLESELRDFVRVRLAAFKVPVAVHIWPGPLPRNPSGKILKTMLKKRLYSEVV